MPPLVQPMWRQADIAAQMRVQVIGRSRTPPAPFGLRRPADHHADQRNKHRPRAMPVDQLLKGRVGLAAPQGKSGNHCGHLSVRQNADALEKTESWENRFARSQLWPRQKPDCQGNARRQISSGLESRLWSTRRDGSWRMSLHNLASLPSLSQACGNQTNLPGQPLAGKCNILTPM